MLKKSYNSIFDFINDKVKITFDGKIKVIKNGSDHLVGSKELKRLCYELKKQIENRQVKLFVKKDCIIIEGL